MKYGDRHYAQVAEGIDASAFDAIADRALAAEDTNSDTASIVGFAYAVLSGFYGYEPANYSTQPRVLRRSSGPLPWMLKWLLWPASTCLNTCFHRRFQWG
jgi:hypothetical protein